MGKLSDYLETNRVEEEKSSSPLWKTRPAELSPEAEMTLTSLGIPFGSASRGEPLIERVDPPQIQEIHMSRDLGNDLESVVIDGVEYGRGDPLEEEYFPYSRESRDTINGADPHEHTQIPPHTHGNGKWVVMEEELSRYETTKGGGAKDLLGKLRFDLIPPEVTQALAQTYTLGASKYDDRNWEKGIPFSVALGALKRHMNEFELGETINTKDGDIEHVAHMMWWCAAILTFIRRGRGDLNDL